MNTIRVLIVTAVGILATLSFMTSSAAGQSGPAPPIVSLIVEDTVGPPGSVVTVSVEIDFDSGSGAIEAFSFGVCHDGAIA